MTFATIATWKSAEVGMNEAIKDLGSGGSARRATLDIINSVEDDPRYKSVGYGGLPNERGVVQTDAAFMDGDTLQVGAVASLENIANPVLVAEKLAHERFNNCLCGKGAYEYAIQNNFETKDMLTKNALSTWRRRLHDVEVHDLDPYDGHDTIGCISLDNNGSMVAATSTSGLFMKKSGRTGDSPMVGSGFYVDSNIGGASATGLGEDLMKGVLSYEIVRMMDDSNGEGVAPQQAADDALNNFIDKLSAKGQRVGAMSLIALSNKGEWGVSTNVEFSFVVASNSKKCTLLIARPTDNKTTEFFEPTQKWLDDYDKQHQYAE